MLLFPGKAVQWCINNLGNFCTALRMIFTAVTECAEYELFWTDLRETCLQAQLSAAKITEFKIQGNVRKTTGIEKTLK